MSSELTQLITELRIANRLKALEIMTNGGSEGSSFSNVTADDQKFVELIATNQPTDTRQRRRPLQLFGDFPPDQFSCSSCPRPQNCGTPACPLREAWKREAEHIIGKDNRRDER